jgi:hypothetical protein
MKNLLEFLNMGFLKPTIWIGWGVEKFISYLDYIKQNQLALMLLSSILEVASGTLHDYDIIEFGERING